MVGFPKSLKSVFGTFAASFNPSNSGCLFDSEVAKTTALAPFLNKVTSGMDNPNTALACNSNSEKFCVPANVTIPVSCGRGDNSEKYAPSFVMKNSTPQIPAPPKAAVTFAAISCASAKCAGCIGIGCQLSW